MYTARFKSSGLFFAILVWAGLVTAGVWQLDSYTRTAGEKAQANLQFPSLSKVHVIKDRPTFVLFLHPKCGCSAATLREFELLLPKILHQASINIIFLRPEGFSDSDIHGSLWENANNIKGVTIMIDDRSQESTLFGAKTSGQTFLYDSSGLLVFDGGLTPSRGHMGETDGQKRIVDFISKGSVSSRLTASVFGCALESQSALAMSPGAQ